jgi:hypothetical protein
MRIIAAFIAAAILLFVYGRWRAFQPPVISEDSIQRILNDTLQMDARIPADTATIYSGGDTIHWKRNPLGTVADTIKGKEGRP